MRAIFNLAIRDMKKRWALMLMLIVLFSVLFGAYITLLSHYKSTMQMYDVVIDNWLVLGNSDGLSEIHGSRVSPAVRDSLISMGYTDPIPEIHQIVGTSLANGTLMKGIRLDDYPQYDTFTIVEGRQLQPGDPPRVAMVGEVLANTDHLKVGGDVTLRGRQFRVVGIFKTGSIQDNEAWVSLEDAQNLLNYGQDVSLYLVPDSGPLKAGDQVGDELIVSQRGENGGFIDKSLSNFLNNYAVMGIVVGIAAVITLANLLFRLAYLRRHEFGVLKSIGFGLSGLAMYFFTQAGILIFAGLIGGTIFGIILINTMMTSLSVFGFGVVVGIDLSVLASFTLIILLFFCVCAFIPLLSIYRKPIPELVGRN